MDIFLFVFEAEPTAASSEYGRVSGASVEVWVHDETSEQAELRAIDYLLTYGWRAVELVNAFQIDAAKIQHHDTVSLSCYNRALKDGVYALFSGYPVQDREDNQTEFRPLKPPQGNKIKH